MALRKRGQTWWLDIATPGGHRLRRSAETTDRKAAQELHLDLDEVFVQANRLPPELQKNLGDVVLAYRKRPKIEG